MKFPCYYHRDIKEEIKEIEVEEAANAYCTLEERKLWIDAIYGKALRRRFNQKPISYIQQKLKEFGEKADREINQPKEMFKKEDFIIPDINLDH